MCTPHPANFAYLPLHCWGVIVPNYTHTQWSVIVFSPIDHAVFFFLNSVIVAY